MVRCQIHNHTLTLCWPQTTEEGGLATSTSTAQEVIWRSRPAAAPAWLQRILGGQAACRQSQVVVLLPNVRSVQAIDHFFQIPSLKCDLDLGP